MATAWQLLTFPFIACGRLLKMLAPPAVVLGVAWLIWDTTDTSFMVIALVSAVWGLIMLRLWWTAVRGRVRSLGRGTVRMSHQRNNRW